MRTNLIHNLIIHARHYPFGYWKAVLLVFILHVDFLGIFMVPRLDWLGSFCMAVLGVNELFFVCFCVNESFTRMRFKSCNPIKS